VGETVEADELLDDGLDGVLLDGVALSSPLLQDGGQREAWLPNIRDAAVQAIVQRLGWG
jgi:hypothetical protein